MLANILLSLLATVGVLTLLDLFLSDAKKQTIQNAALIIWNATDELKRKPLTAWLNHRYTQILFSLSSALGCGGLILFIFLSMEWGSLGNIPLLGAYLIIIVIFGVFCTLMITMAQVFALNPAKIISRSVRFAVRFSIALVVVGVLFVITNKSDPWAILLFLMSFIELLIIVSGMFSLAFSLAPIVAGYIISSTLYVVEFIVRRVAECPKGPLLAACALFSGIVALLKTVAG